MLRIVNYRLNFDLFILFAIDLDQLLLLYFN